MLRKKKKEMSFIRGQTGVMCRKRDNDAILEIKNK